MSTIEGTPPVPPDETDELATLEAAYQAARTNPTEQPQLEAVFDPGQIYLSNGSLQVGRNLIEWELAVPENLSQPKAAGFVPGYLGIFGSSLRPALAAAHEGIPTFRYTPGRKGKSRWEDARHPQRLHVHTLEQLTDHLATTELERDIPNISEVEFDEWILLAHSMGLITALLFAKKHPELVKAVMGYAGCGLGHPRLLQVGPSALKGALPGIHHEIRPSLSEGDIELTRDNAEDMIEYAAPLPRLVAEGLSCTFLDLRHVARDVQKANVPVGQQVYEFDSLIPPDPRMAQYVSYFEILRGAGHMAPLRKSAYVARRMANFIHSLKT